MDARRRINQNKRKSGGGPGGGNRRPGGQPGKGRKNVPGSGGRRRVVGSKGASSSPGKAKKTIKRTATGLKVVTGNKKTKPISDLRQLIKPKTTPQTKQSAIKKRLGLQSSSARERAKKAGRTTARMDEEVIVVRKPAVAGRVGSKNRVWRRNDVVTSSPAAPTVIIAQPASSSLVSSSGRSSGHSIIVSNLHPKVTQKDILDLFGDVGSLESYQMINSTTAMVSYTHPSDAKRAIEAYNNRFLDGLPMQVTLIPDPSAAASRSVSQSFRRVFLQDQ